MLLVGLRFEDGGAALVSGNFAVKLFELVELFDGNAEFLNFEGAGVEGLAKIDVLKPKRKAEDAEPTLAKSKPARG